MFLKQSTAYTILLRQGYLHYCVYLPQFKGLSPSKKSNIALEESSIACPSRLNAANRTTTPVNITTKQPIEQPTKQPIEQPTKAFLFFTN
jgi:hypothetical protein